MRCKHCGRDIQPAGQRGGWADSDEITVCETKPRGQTVIMHEPEWWEPTPAAPASSHAMPPGPVAMIVAAVVTIAAIVVSVIHG